mmetsp:Transcript_95443/g.131262  ORF Transcript_95443/g.131262 Transcript_95443/m.131262 type:complete len:143 (+) Transcript_95443:1904-2332(+)
MACILIELYTGELFFDTHENTEHLAMIEKATGIIPYKMLKNCNNQAIKDQFILKLREDDIEKRGMRLNWPQVARKKESVYHVEQMPMLNDIIWDSFGPEHRQFRSLLEFMFIIDPDKRPSAEECLNHAFFEKEGDQKDFNIN